MKLAIGSWRWLALVVLISGCVTRPVVLTPVEPVSENQESVELLSVSTRQKSDVPGIIYSGERSKDVHIQSVRVAVPTDHKAGELRFSFDAKPDLRTDFAVTSIEDLQPGNVEDWFKKREHTKRLFIFVHGYNMSYGIALYTLAQLSYDLDVDATPILFSWPSRGRLDSYLYDKESATLNRDRLEELLQLAIESDQVEEITILAHSMGSWVTSEALRQMAIRNDGNVHEKISNVIFAAPDIDVDVFQSQINAATGTRPFFTLITSQDDKALKFSRILAGDVDRLGAIDINNEKYRQGMQDYASNLMILDLSEIATGYDAFDHTKYAESPLALDIVSRRIKGAEQDDGDMSLATSILLTLSQNVAKIETITQEVEE